MKNSNFKKIILLCMNLLLISTILNAQIIDDDFEGGFPNGAWTGYVPESDCGHHVYWVEDVMNDGCRFFPPITGDGDFMTIDVGDTRPSSTVWERTGLDLSGCYTFSIDVVHRFASPGNSSWPAEPVDLLLRSNGDSMADLDFITIDLNTSFYNITVEVEIPDGTTSLSLLNITDACWNCDFGIDNIILECCGGGYYFDVYESNYEDCCIEVDAGSTSSCNNWHLEINGTTYYPGDENHFNNFLHCLDENDTYLVEFFVDNELYLEEEVDLTNCEDCEDSYYFNAYQSTYTDCCIEVDAGSNNDCTNWYIEVNGTAYYPGDENHFDNFLHCLDENGIYLVEFFVDGQLYGYYEIDLVNCGGDCEDCELEEPEFTILEGSDDCSIQFCSVSVDYQDPCNEIVEWTVDYGDGTVNTYGHLNNCLEHTYSCNGIYDVCIYVIVSDGEDLFCSEFDCVTIEITDCGDCCYCEDPIIEAGIIINNECSVAVCVHSECPGATYEWDFGDGNVYTGTSVEHTYDCNGEYEYCWTMSYTDLQGNLCEISDCDMITISECGECGCDETTAPTNLQVFPSGILYWNPVPGAIGYIISSPGRFINCRCRSQISLWPIQVESSEAPPYFLPGSLENQCFAWQVQAICADGTITEPSEPSCYTGIIFDQPGGGDYPRGGDGRSKLSNSNGTIVSVYPNPITNKIFLSLISSTQNQIDVQVFDQAGKTLINEVKTAKEGFNQYEFELRDLPQGIYFIKLFNNEMNHIQKLIKK